MIQVYRTIWYIHQSILACISISQKNLKTP